MGGFCAYLGLLLITLLPWVSQPLLQDTSPLEADPIGMHGKTPSDFMALEQSLNQFVVFTTKWLTYFLLQKIILAALCSNHLDILHAKTISLEGLQSSVLSLPPGYCWFGLQTAKSKHCDL